MAEASVVGRAWSFWTVQKGEIVVERRRRWTPERKAALVAEAGAEGGRVSVVARRHGMSASLLYNRRSAWKAAARAVRGGAPTLPGFIQLGVAADRAQTGSVLSMTVGVDLSKAAAEDRPLPIRERRQPKRKPLPEQLRRHEVVHEPEHDGACTCPPAAAPWRGWARTSTEVLDYIPGRLRVIRHARPKYACRQCGRPRPAGAPSGVEIHRSSAAAMYSILQIAKLNVNPQGYLTDTLARIADGHPINRIAELMPWNLSAGSANLAG